MAAGSDTKRQAGRFILVGLATAALEYGVIAGLIAAGMSPYLTRTLSMPLAMVAAWQLNRRFTFATQAPASIAEFLRYAATALLGFAINYALYSASLWLGLPVWAAFVIGTGVSAVFNFLRQRLLLAGTSR